MSPERVTRSTTGTGGPRASGDEPWVRGTEKARCEWSPRERG